MEQYVDVYEGLADRENTYLSPQHARREIRELFSYCCWEGDPDDVEPVFTLELLEEDGDGTGLYTDGGGQFIWLRPDQAGIYYDEASTWMQEDPRVETLAEAIEDASNLDDLAEALNSLAGIDPDLREAVEDEIDMTSLPTFGGPEPDDTLGVWSWDETRLLVGDSQPFEIVPRPHDEDDEE